MVVKFSEIVKQQIDYWAYQVANYGPGHPRYRPAKINKYQHLIREFSELHQYLCRQEGAAPAPEPEPAPKEPPAPSAHEIDLRRHHRRPLHVHLFGTPVTPEPSERRADDLSDLPPELLKELSDNARGEADPIIKVIEGRGGTATLDEILIDLYRKFKEVGKRPIVANKLYRLSRRGLCWSVPGKKGCYTTIEPDRVSDEETDEGPDGGTPEPSSNGTGVAGSPEGSTKPAPVGSTPSTSTQHRRDLFAGAAIPSGRIPR